MRYLTFALAVSGAAALSVTPPPLLPRGFTSLRARQLDPSAFPPQCQTQCGPVTTDSQTCTTNACTCTTQVANDYQTCLNCLAALAVSAGLNNPSITSDIQTAANSFNEQCAAVNPNLAPITIPAGVPTGSGSLSGGLSATGTGLNTGTRTPIGTGLSSAPSFGSSSLGGGLGGGLSTGVGGAGSLPLSTQTAATLPNAGGTATGSGSLSGTAGAKASAGYRDSSVHLVVVIITGLIGAAAPYLC